MHWMASDSESGWACTGTPTSSETNFKTVWLFVIQHARWQLRRRSRHCRGSVTRWQLWHRGSRRLSSLQRKCRRPSVREAENRTEGKVWHKQRQAAPDVTERSSWVKVNTCVLYGASRSVSSHLKLAQILLFLNPKCLYVWNLFLFFTNNHHPSMLWTLFESMCKCSLFLSKVTFLRNFPWECM